MKAGRIAHECDLWLFGQGAFQSVQNAYSVFFLDVTISLNLKRRGDNVRKTPDAISQEFGSAPKKRSYIPGMSLSDSTETDN
jgi:hypothetical protein